MTTPEKAELDESSITDDARRFAAELFARFPELRRHAAMERVKGYGTWTLVVTVPAPSGDPRSELVIWVDGGDDPSVAFGSWHTHEAVWGCDPEEGGERSALLGLVAGIFADRFVLCDDTDYTGGPFATLLDLAEDDALLEELTSAGSPGRARLRSWSGRLDRDVAIEDFESDPA